MKNLPTSQFRVQMANLLKVFVGKESIFFLITFYLGVDKPLSKVSLFVS